MFTAIKKAIEINNGIKTVVVDFTDGVSTVTERCIPQDADGFRFWVKSRLATYNAEIAIPDDTEIDVSDPVVTPPVLTQDEIDRNTWFTNYYRWVKIKTTLIDTGIIPATNPKAVAMLADLKTTLKAEYIDLL